MSNQNMMEYVFDELEGIEHLVSNQTEMEIINTLVGLAKSELKLQIDKSTKRKKRKKKSSINIENFTVNSIF